MGEDEAPLLAPGFRFHPTDDELVSYYLKRKVSAKPFRVDAIAEIDLYKSEPWDLPGQSRLKSRDMEWYFFTALDKKYGHGSRTNRSTEQGYWKTTGKDHPVFHNSRIVGARKTLVFHHGRAPKGDRTNWVMHEYRLEDEDLANKGVPQDAFVVCRIFQKSGAGPKNGEQYGAPFVEEEWEDEEKVMVVVSKVEKDQGDGSGSGSGDTISHAPMQLPAILPVAEFEKPDSGDPFEAADPVGFLEMTEEDQDVSHLLQLHAGGQNFLDDVNGSTNFSELYQTLPTVEDENFMDLDDLFPAEDEDGNHYYPNSQNSMHYAPPPSQNISPAEDGHFVELNDLVGPVDTNPSGFELVDEYLTYFEATNDNLEKYLSPLGSCSSKLEPEMADPSVHPEKIAKEHVVESASSKRKAKTCDDLGDTIVVDDLGYDDGSDGWGKSLAKRLHGMLGSIPSAPAFAAEDPLKGMAKYAGQSSGAHSGSSINVQAGMLCVSDFTVTSTSRKHWPLQDDRYYATEYLMSSSLSLGEKASRSLMFQSGFYLCFLWVLLLAVTCKVGLYVYTR